MKLSFRWYGPADPVPLAYIRQIPNMHSAVTAVYDVPVGQPWPDERIAALAQEIEGNGLHFDVIESVPVHEDIKLGLPTRDACIDAYITTLRRLAAHGVRCVCYNFMPVFDWTRTTLDQVNPDGSTCLAYDVSALETMDPLTGELSLPGWDSGYEKNELRTLFEQYKEVDAETLWKNLGYFLNAVIPVCEEVGITMAIHPDDPPYTIFGLPRIITNEANLDRLLKLVDSPANSLTLCTGALGCAAFNDIPHIVEKFAAMGRIRFLHMRNVRIYDNGSFDEAGHFSGGGNLDMAEIMSVLVRHHFDGYIRPDHGRMIWGEQGKPGYGLFDRALGAAYLNGLWEACEKMERRAKS